MGKIVHFMCVLILILTLIGSLQVAPVRALTTTFMVDTPTDAHDSYLADGICSNGVDGCSLRAAIEQAFPLSSAGTPVTIHFWSGIAGTLTLNLGMLDLVASYVTLDGEGNGITISGAGLSAGQQSILRVSGSHNTISHLTFSNSPWDGIQVGDFAGVGEGNHNILDYLTVVHSVAGGVYIHGSGLGGYDNQVTNSFIGSISTGNICASQYANGFDGIYIDGGAARTILDHDQIVCNGHNGVFLNGTGGAIDGTEFSYQEIGTDGSGAMGNGWNGIHLINASNTQINGSVISGNNQAGLSGDSRAGIWLENSHDNSIQNNVIGTNAAGSYSLGNLGEGVQLSDGSTGNLVGNESNINVISGNGGSGVRLESGAHANTLNRNLIGLNLGATAAIPNGLAGVAVIGAENNTIGSPGSTVNQYISGNYREGIYIENSNFTRVGPRTLIGIGADGVTPLGNWLEGIRLTGTSRYSGILAGSIVWNGAAGIAIEGDASVGNIHRPEKIYANGGLAIDLGNDGHTANGAHSGPPGPNNWLPYPVITAAGAHSLSGTACPDCRVELYQAYGNPLAIAGGGTRFATVFADGAGNWSAALPGAISPTEVTTIACDESAGGDSSEMSPLYTGAVGFRVFLPLVSR